MCSCMRWNFFRRFRSSQSLAAATAPVKDTYFKRGANVTLGDKYKTVNLSNGVSVYMLDKDVEKELESPAM